MSDFLTNLVMRSFAQTPSVQPMTLSTYAAPEPQIDPVENFVEPSAPKTTEPVQTARSVQHTDEREAVIEKISAVEPPTIQQIHSEKISQSHEPKVTHQSVAPELIEEPRVMSQPDQTIAPPAQPVVVKTPAVQVQKTSEPLIVEQVIEKVVERPTVKTIERPTVKTIEHSTIETIDRQSVTSRERTIDRSSEKSSITIENTEHVTSSFTTLVPKAAPQSLPAINLKHRPTQPQPAIPDEEQQQTTAPSPETVINVAIGRIEVRATPATPQRRERHGPKVMTLDDYLQQRSRGAQ